MKIFLIRFNKWDYDKYCGFVIVAKNEKEVISNLEKGKNLSIGTPKCIPWKGGYKIKEIKPENYKKTTIILEDFNAG